MYTTCCGSVWKLLELFHKLTFPLNIPMIFFPSLLNFSRNKPYLQQALALLLTAH